MFFCFERVAKNLQRCLLWTEMLNLLVESVEIQYWSAIYFDTKSRCSCGKLFCPKCPYFSTKSRDDINYHNTKNNSAAGPTNNHKCKECSIEFPSFSSVRHHKQHNHTAETTSSGEKVEMRSTADAGEDKSFEVEIQSCGNFSVDSEIPYILKYGSQKPYSSGYRRKTGSRSG